jgi:hypothetical protein
MVDTFPLQVSKLGGAAERDGAAQHSQVVGHPPPDRRVLKTQPSTELVHESPVLRDQGHALPCVRRRQRY